MSRRASAMAIFFLMLIACGSSSSPSKRAGISLSPAAGGSLGSLGSAGCAPAAAFHGWVSPGGPPEVGLDSPRGSLWALFFNPVPPPAGKEIKVVWRMTGFGDFTFRISDAAGMVVPLAWGPESHTGSNWAHPGDEVGTGFNFPHAGCWDIHVARSNTHGDLWLEVVASFAWPVKTRVGASAGFRVNSSSSAIGSQPGLGAGGAEDPDQSTDSRPRLEVQL